MLGIKARDGARQHVNQDDPLIGIVDRIHDTVRATHAVGGFDGRLICHTVDELSKLDGVSITAGNKKRFYQTTATARWMKSTAARSECGRIADR